MPRASNRVGVELDMDQTPPADLLKAKKAERRARARQRAEEKRLKEEAAATSSEPAVAATQAVEQDPSGISSDAPTSQQPAAECRPTARGKLDKLQTPEVVEDEPLDAHKSVDEPASVGFSSLEEARTEFGTEEVIDMDAYVIKLSTEVAQLSQRSRASPPESVGQQYVITRPKHVHSSPTSPDVAAFRIQKALKRKFLKKCTSFLRHSSKVFAEVDFASQASTVSASPVPEASASASAKQQSDVDSNHHKALDGGDSPGERLDKRKTRPKADPHVASENGGKRLKERATKRDKSKHVKRNRRRESSSSSSSGESRESSSSNIVDESSPTTSSSFRSSRSESFSSSSGSGSSSSSSTPGGPTLDLLHSLVLGADPVTDNTDEPDRSRQYAPDVYSYSAVKIQAWLRGVDGRKQALVQRVELEREIESEALLEVHEEASVRIQAIVRGFLLRRQLGIMDKSPVGLRKSPNSKPKKKNRRPSFTAFFRSDETDGLPAKAVDKRTASIQKEAEQPVTTDAIRKDSTEDVAEWPAEFNLEGLDDWEELNSPANASGDLVTHAHFLSKGKLRVFCGTWNMHAKLPVDDLRLWIPLNKYHVVAVGSEECVHSIAKSVVFTSKKQWEDRLKETLGNEYVLVSSHSLTAIHNIVFVHESIVPLLSHIQSDAVATGLGNQLGNKGGVGIAFAVGDTSLAFVNCHFDAHQHNTDKRNANFHRINRELRLVPASQSVHVASSSLQASASGAVTGQASLDGLGRTTTSRFSVASTVAPQTDTKKRAVSEIFDRVFWFGDLNYRINGTRRMVDLLLLHNRHDVLRFNDQLAAEMAQGRVFAHFHEGPLNFRPTYKFDRHSDVYDSSSKQRIPSWTDRILFLSNDKAADVDILSYRSHMSFQTSDHRPVGAAFQVNFKKHTTGDGIERLVEGREEAADFSRVLARGYRPSVAKSEVCVVQ